EADPDVADGQPAAVVGDLGVLGGQGPVQLLGPPLLGQGPGQVARLLQQAADPAVADGQLAAVGGGGGGAGGPGPAPALGTPAARPGPRPGRPPSPAGRRPGCG